MTAFERYGMTMVRDHSAGCHLISENYAYALQLILGFAALAGLVVSRFQQKQSVSSCCLSGFFHYPDVNSSVTTTNSSLMSGRLRRHSASPILFINAVSRLCCSGDMFNAGKSLLRYVIVLFVVFNRVTAPTSTVPISKNRATHRLRAVPTPCS